MQSCFIKDSASTEKAQLLCIEALLNHLRIYEPMETFATYLKRARLEKGYTMWELSKQVDMLVNEVEHLERGKRMPSMEELNKLTSALGGGLLDCLF